MKLLSLLSLLIGGTTLFAAENSQINNQNIACITSQNKKYVFSDLFVQSSKVLKTLKEENCTVVPFDFSFSRNVLKKIDQDLKIYRWVNPTSIEKCMIAHQLEIDLHAELLIESLWKHDRERFFSLDDYRLAILNTVLKSDKANVLKYSLQTNKPKKFKFRKFQEKVYITTQGVAFKPIERPATSEFFIQKFMIGKKGCTWIRFPLPYYFNREYFSLDYFLSHNKYNFLVVEQSLHENEQYNHLFDSDDHVVTIRTPYFDKIKCEYDKSRGLFYVLSAKLLMMSSNIELSLQRYDIATQPRKIADISHLDVRYLLKQFQLAKNINKNTFEFFVDLLDGNAYLLYESDDLWHVLVFSPQATHAMYHAFDQIPVISAIKEGSLIQFYQANNLIVESFNLSTNRFAHISEIPLENATEIFISQHGKFLVLREDAEGVFTDYIYDVDSGGLLSDYHMKNLPQMTEFRGDSFLLMKFLHDDGIRKQYVLISLHNLEEQVKHAQQLTIQELISYCKNSRLEKLRH